MIGSRTYRLSFWRGIFFLLIAIGLVITWVRFTQGIGAITNLSDRYPWGLWVGFDLLCGIGLAAGSFTIAAAVYIFNLKRFRPLVRPALLTGFLGYLLEVFALMYDLGRPWNLWHPLVMWNPKSVMFVVSWCVMLYSSVMALEVSGMIFEKVGWKRALRVQRSISVPLVIVGVLLATLHQFSLGSMYLIVPGKLHALWYTPRMPVLFLVSSIAAGLAMVIFESQLSSRVFGRALEMHLLRDVGRILVAILALYGVLRVFDLVDRGVFAQVFARSYESAMVRIELGVGLVLPCLLLAFERVRNNARWLYFSAVLVVAGFILNRMNVSITGLEAAQGGHYLPSWAEVMVTLMLVGIGFAAFGVAVKHFNVFPEERAAAAPALQVRRGGGRGKRPKEAARG